jgi:phosphatidylglycerol:prolipoprotein diacylglycerol transferase
MLHSPGPIIVDLGQLFNLGVSLPLRWYGLLTGLGFLSAMLIIFSKIKDSTNEAQKQNLFDLLLWCFIGGIIGARLWFVILSFSYFSKNPLEVFYIWQGGQSIQGGLLGGFVSGFLFYKFKSTPDQLPFWKVADLVALGLPAAQAIGRWGNFFNIEAFGKPTNLPWGLFVPPELRPTQYLGFNYFHPTFLYESLYLILVAIVLQVIYKKQNLPVGSLFWWYLILYSIERFFLEALRTDSLLIGPFAAAQVVCLVTIFLSGSMIYYLQRKIDDTNKL